MEARDIRIIQENAPHNYKLDRLYREHLELDHSIHSLSAKALSPNEQLELHRMKKRKLEGREEMEKILKSLRH